jgi:acyl-CoA synthetase (AMP-forming)/AMP-acid ligase II
MTLTGTEARPDVTCLLGSPAATSPRPLEEVIRPADTTGAGISFIGGEQFRLTYAELAALTAIAAARLREAGVRQGSRVAQTIENDLPSIIGVLATWAAGATVVSVPPAARNAREWYCTQFAPVLASTGCEFLLGEEDLAVRLAQAARARQIPRWPLIGAAGSGNTGPGPAIDDGPDIPATALIQFTSGSVGTPRGVAITSTALAGHLQSIETHVQVDAAADRFLSWLPLYHDMGLICMFLTALATRTNLSLASPASFSRQPASWLTALAAERATVTAAPDFAYRLAAAVPYEAGTDLSRVRAAICGGERISWQTMERFHAATAPLGMRWQSLMPGYGLAEGTLTVTGTPPGRGPHMGPDGHVSVGVPLPGAQVRAPAHPSVDGSIAIRGDWVMDGYHTTEGFDAVPPGAWFDTGDAGFAHEGELYVLGRRDEVVSVAGRNVYAEDLESVARHAAGDQVNACAAFRSPSAPGRFGLVAEANPRIVRDRADAAGLARRLQAVVSRTVGTRPAPVLVVRLGVIPRTTSGKMRRAQCRAMHQAGEFGKRVLAELA